jgi:hypothetical protein
LSYRCASSDIKKYSRGTPAYAACRSDLCLNSTGTLSI